MASSSCGSSSNLEVEETGLNWLGSYSAYGINAVFVENYWNAGSPVQQSRFIDDFVVSTQRIGPSIDASAGASGTSGSSTTTGGASASGGATTTGTGGGSATWESLGHPCW